MEKEKSFFDTVSSYFSKKEEEKSVEKSETKPIEKEKITENKHETLETILVIAFVVICLVSLYIFKDYFPESKQDSNSEFSPFRWIKRFFKWIF